MDLDFISGTILDSAIRIHRRTGPGLFESVYEVVLAKDLERRGLYVERQKAIPMTLDGIVFEEGFRLDLLVERAVVVEIKSSDRLAPVHFRQVLTYLRLLDLRLGLLINFGGATLKEGFKRVVNRYDDSAPRRALRETAVGRPDAGRSGASPNVATPAERDHPG